VGRGWLLAVAVLLVPAAGCTQPAAPSGSSGSAASSTASTAAGQAAPTGQSSTLGAGAPPSGTASGADQLHLTAAGDYGSNPASAGRVLDGVRRAAPDAHLALGDLSYGRSGEEAQWCRFVRAHVGDGIPVELVAGNHESDGLNGRIDAFAACLPNRLRGLSGTYARQWYVDLPAASPVVRVVLISPGLTFPDGTWDYSKGTARYAWTAAAIKGARTAGIPFVVVGMHQPCLSVGRYSCSAGSDLLDLLVSQRVDLVLTGHEHLYQRTKQLAEGPGCARIPVGRYEPACVVSSGGSGASGASGAPLVAGAGTVFVGVGTGGVPLRALNVSDPEAGYFAAASGANRNPTYGHVDLTVSPSALRLRFVADAGGTFSDEMTLTRPAGSGPAEPTPSSTAGG
jgi:hypothetical protein